MLSDIFCLNKAAWMIWVCVNTGNLVSESQGKMQQQRKEQCVYRSKLCKQWVPGGKSRGHALPELLEEPALPTSWYLSSLTPFGCLTSKTKKRHCLKPPSFCQRGTLVPQLKTGSHEALGFLYLPELTCAVLILCWNKLRESRDSPSWSCANYWFCWTAKHNHPCVVPASIQCNLGSVSSYSYISSWTAFAII